jgi:predicted AAA+ superfamily ATPase
MVNRTYWQSLIEKCWQERSVVWLYGVRRVGKTFLCRSLPKVEYFDCELPRIRRMMVDPEAFLADHKSSRIVLDEIHRLQHPTELLKIAADHFPSCRVLATGSSTLAASSKFRDTLTGRKRNIWLTPMTLADLTDFGATHLKHRLLHGGLPPFFLSEQLPEGDFQEWMDDYWSKDIQELFRLESRSSFQRFVELVLAQSGGMFEASSFAAPCEVSRTTIANYLKVLEATMVAHVVRPFSSHRPTEIVAAPRVYGFDTGFVCTFRGWQSLRDDDLGPLWEHFVLNEMQARMQDRRVMYWRDKRHHEVDFVATGERQAPTAIECKWKADRFEPAGIKAFRRQYPTGENVVVAQDVDRPYSRNYGDLSVRFVGLDDLLRHLTFES